MEEWKEVSESNGLYEISSEGRLRQCSGINRRTGRLLKPQTRPNGYVQATLRHACGKTTYPLVHRLVAKAFIGSIPDKYQVNHKNGNRSDNFAENLEIVTCSENNLHAFRALGRKALKGEDHPNSKLSEVDVLDIRWLFGMGVRQCILAKEYCLDATVIRDIVHCYRWKHI